MIALSVVMLAGGLAQTAEPLLTDGRGVRWSIDYRDDKRLLVGRVGGTEITAQAFSREGPPPAVVEDGFGRDAYSTFTGTVCSR